MGIMTACPFSIERLLRPSAAATVSPILSRTCMPSFKRRMTVLCAVVCLPALSFAQSFDVADATATGLIYPLEISIANMGACSQLYGEPYKKMHMEFIAGLYPVVRGAGYADPSKATSHFMERTAAMSRLVLATNPLKTECENEMLPSARKVAANHANYMAKSGGK